MSKIRLRILAIFMTFLVVMVAGGAQVNAMQWDLPPTADKFSRGYFKNGKIADGSIEDMVLTGGLRLCPNGCKTKSDFINYFKDMRNNGIEQDKIGVNFLISAMLNSPRNASGGHDIPTDADVARWENAINNPDVDLHIGDITLWLFTSYMPEYKEIASIYYYEDDSNVIMVHEPQPGMTIRSRSTGKIYFKMQWDCANSADNYPGLPPYNPDQPPAVNIDNSVGTGLSCDNQTLSGVATDPNYNGSLRVGIYQGGTLLGTDWTDPGTKKYSYSVAGKMVLGATFTVRVSSVDSSGNVVPGGTEASASITRGPCNAAHCGSPVSGTRVVNIPNTFNISVTVDAWHPSFNTNDPKLSVTIRNPAGAVLPAGSVTVSPYTLTNAGSGKKLDATVTFTPTTKGHYPIVWSLNGLSANTAPMTITCDGDGVVDGGPLNPHNGEPSTPDGGGYIAAGDRPYFGVYGGDIIAGIPLGGVTSPGASGILSWNNDNAPFFGDYRGAGTTHAGIASGILSSYITASGNGAPNMLAFKTGGTAGTYGGSFTAFSPAPDYYDSGAPAGSTTLSGTVNLGTLVSGTYSFPSSPSGMRVSGTLPAGQNVTIYANGPVYITGNILYGSHTLQNIPRLSIYANGNIVVDHTVTEMHGIFVTETNNFYSCGTNGLFSTDKRGVDVQMGDFTSVPGNYANLCSTPLKVYGSVVAKRLVLSRLPDSYTNAVQGEPYTASHAAERFIHTPESWIVRPANPNAHNRTFDDYVSMPPVL